MNTTRCAVTGCGGFTLIELIIVIILTGILAGVLFMILRGPLQAYIQVERRVALVDIIETAMQRMTREIRLALPYSVRVDSPGGLTAVEFLRTLDGGRYRDRGVNRLKFNQSSGTFDVLNSLVNIASIQAASNPPSQKCINSTADCLVVYNIGQPSSVAAATANGFSANAYLGSSNAYKGNIAAITAAGANSISFSNSDLPSWSFGMQSPQQRFHIVDTPVSFICNGSEIHRYSDYPISPNQPSSPGGSDNLLIDQVTACDIDYVKPTLTRFGLLTINITVTDPASGESASLLQQIHMTNVP